MFQRTSLLVAVILVTAPFGLTSVPVCAQTSSSVDVVPSLGAKPTKEQRRAARKEARVRKNAELKQLEDGGYSPETTNYSNYPKNMQNAETNTGRPKGASE